MYTRDLWLRVLVTLGVAFVVVLLALWLLGCMAIPRANAGLARCALVAPLPTHTDPGANALNVPITSNVSITFDEPISLTFVNTREMDCGTVCAAQTQPGEYLFGGDQSNWFTYITYNKGDGTAGSPKTYPIYTGKTHLCGTLYVHDDGTHIFVNYVLTDMGDCTLTGLSEYHLQVNDTLDDLKKKILNKGGNPVPGKCTYKGTLDPMQSETGWIECDSKKDDISDWSDPIYIFAHGVGCYYCP